MSKKRIAAMISMTLALITVLAMALPAAAAQSVDQTAMLKVTNKTYLSANQGTAKKDRIAELPKGSLVNLVEAGSKYYKVSVGGTQGYVLKKNLRSSWGYGPVGNIKINGTKINYTTAIGNDNAYYMAYTEKDKKSKNGAIFFDFRNMDVDRRLNLILYGHNMKNGSMFAGLHKYEDASFFNTNNTVRLGFNTGFSFTGGYKEYRVFAAAALDTGADTNFWKTEFANASAVQGYANNMYTLCKSKEGGNVMEGFSSSNVSEMITLITCTSPTDLTGRYVVFAYR